MSFEPLFLDGPAGRLFGIYHPPSPSAPARGGIVYVPPFAEEMNQCRRMAALQARALAEAGVGVLLLDLYGTGDSGGDFEEARWNVWCDDARAGAAWLRGRVTGPLGLLGLRLGGLLAMQVAGASPGQFSQVLLWQPVVKGETQMTQFLRLRVAGAVGRPGPAEKTGDLRHRLASGETLEVAGYRLTPELAAGIEGASLDGMALDPGVRIRWFEVTQSDDATASPASLRVVDTWREQGQDISLRTLPGEPFWRIQETTLVPALWEATVSSWCEP